MPVRLSGGRAGPDAFVLGAALRACATVPRPVGVAVTWFGPRQWRLSVTPAPPDTAPPDTATNTGPDDTADAIDDDYRVAATVFVDFDEDAQGRRIVRLAAEPMLEPFRPPRVDDDDEPVAEQPPVPRELDASRLKRARLGAETAIEIGRTLAVGMHAVSAPTTGGEQAATANGLAGPAPMPDPPWQADRSQVTTLRTLLTPDELLQSLRDVPFARRTKPGATPVVFVVGDSGHAADQVVTLTVAGDDAPGSTVLLSYLVESSGDPLIDAVVSTRARACAETICSVVLDADRWAVRDDSPGGAE